jgi:hypothetical protein
MHESKQDADLRRDQSITEIKEQQSLTIFLFSGGGVRSTGSLYVFLWHT